MTAYPEVSTSSRNAQVVQVVKFPITKGHLNAPIIIIIGNLSASLADTCPVCALHGKTVEVNRKISLYRRHLLSWIGVS